LPECLQFESEHYSSDWRSVKNLDAQGLDRKIGEAGWTFFFMAGEVEATVIGSDSERTRRRAARNLIVKMQADRPNESNTFNCLEIARVAVKRFLGIPYVTVSAHPRHIQESMFSVPHPRTLRNGTGLNWQPLDPRQPLTEEKKHRTRDGRAR